MSLGCQLASVLLQLFLVTVKNLDSSSALLAVLLVQAVDLCPRFNPELALDELPLPSILESPFLSV